MDAYLLLLLWLRASEWRRKFLGVKWKSKLLCWQRTGYWFRLKTLLWPCVGVSRLCCKPRAETPAATLPRHPSNQFPWQPCHLAPLFKWGWWGGKEEYLNRSGLYSQLQWKSSRKDESQKDGSLNAFLCYYENYSIGNLLTAITSNGCNVLTSWENYLWEIREMCIIVNHLV